MSWACSKDSKCLDRVSHSGEVKCPPPCCIHEHLKEIKNPALLDITQGNLLFCLYVGSVS